MLSLLASDKKKTTTLSSSPFRAQEMANNVQHYFQEVRNNVNNPEIIQVIHTVRYQYNLPDSPVSLDSRDLNSPNRSPSNSPNSSPSNSPNNSASNSPNNSASNSPNNSPSHGESPNDADFPLDAPHIPHDAKSDEDYIKDFGLSKCEVLITRCSVNTFLGEPQKKSTDDLPSESGSSKHCLELTKKSCKDLRIESGTSKKSDEDLRIEPSTSKKSDEDFRIEPSTSKKWHEDLRIKPGASKKYCKGLLIKPGTSKKSDKNLRTVPSTSKKPYKDLRIKSCASKKSEKNLQTVPSTSKKSDESLRVEYKVFNPHIKLRKLKPSLINHLTRSVPTKKFKVRYGHSYLSELAVEASKHTAKEVNSTELYKEHINSRFHSLKFKPFKKLIQKAARVYQKEKLDFRCRISELIKRKENVLKQMKRIYYETNAYVLLSNEDTRKLKHCTVDVGADCKWLFADCKSISKEEAKGMEKKKMYYYKKYVLLPKGVEEAKCKEAILKIKHCKVVLNPAHLSHSLHSVRVLLESITENEKEILNSRTSCENDSGSISPAQNSVPDACDSLNIAQLDKRKSLNVGSENISLSADYTGKDENRKNYWDENMKDNWDENMKDNWDENMKDNSDENKKDYWDENMKSKISDSTNDDQRDSTTVWCPKDKIHIEVMQKDIEYVKRAVGNVENCKVVLDKLQLTKNGLNTKQNFEVALNNQNHSLHAMPVPQMDSKKWQKKRKVCDSITISDNLQHVSHSSNMGPVSMLTEANCEKESNIEMKRSKMDNDTKKRQKKRKGCDSQTIQNNLQHLSHSSNMGQVVVNRQCYSNLWEAVQNNCSVFLDSNIKGFKIVKNVSSPYPFVVDQPTQQDLLSANCNEIGPECISSYSNTEPNTSIFITDQDSQSSLSSNFSIGRTILRSSLMSDLSDNEDNYTEQNSLPLTFNNSLNEVLETYSQSSNESISPEDHITYSQSTNDAMPSQSYPESTNDSTQGASQSTHDLMLSQDFTQSTNDAMLSQSYSQSTNDLTSPIQQLTSEIEDKETLQSFTHFLTEIVATQELLVEQNDSGATVTSSQETCELTQESFSLTQETSSLSHSSFVDIDARLSQNSMTLADASADNLENPLNDIHEFSTESNILNSQEHCDLGQQNQIPSHPSTEDLYSLDFPLREEEEHFNVHIEVESFSETPSTGYIIPPPGGSGDGDPVISQDSAQSKNILDTWSQEPFAESQNSQTITTTNVTTHDSEQSLNVSQSPKSFASHQNGLDSTVSDHLTTAHVTKQDSDTEVEDSGEDSDNSSSTVIIVDGDNSLTSANEYNTDR